MEPTTVEYECTGENGRATVTVDLAAVINVIDEALAPEVATLFVAAAERTGVQVTTLMDELYESRRIYQGQPDHPFWTVWACGIDPQPDVRVETWTSPQPWPVFVSIGADIVAEFYPVGFSGFSE